MEQNLPFWQVQSKVDQKTRDGKVTDQEIDTNPLPLDVKEKLGEFLDWLDVHYETKNGATGLYWQLSYVIASEIERTK